MARTSTPDMLHEINESKSTVESSFMIGYMAKVKTTLFYDCSFSMKTSDKLYTTGLTMAVQEVAVVGVPTVQLKPGYNWQIDEHPSPLLVLPSSQGRTYTLPSPQISSQTVELMSG